MKKAGVENIHQMPDTPKHKVKPYNRKTKNSFQNKTRKSRVLISFIFIHLIFTSSINTKTEAGSAHGVTGICKFSKDFQDLWQMFEDVW